MSSTSANTNQTDPLRHPLEATAMAIKGAATGEARAPRASHMQSANEGPADIIAKVSGAVRGGKREDDGAYFTNNEGIPWPDAYAFTLAQFRTSDLIFIIVSIVRLLAAYLLQVMSSCSSKNTSLEFYFKIT